MSAQLFSLVSDTQGWRDNHEFVFSLCKSAHSRHVYSMLETQFTDWNEINLPRLLSFIKEKLKLSPYDADLVIAEDMVQQTINIKEKSSPSELKLALLSRSLMDTHLRPLTARYEAFPGLDDIIPDLDGVIGEYVERRNMLLGKDKRELVFSPDLLLATDESEFIWPQPKLQQAINGLPTGTLVVLGARPELGKTTFLIDVAVTFARQLEEAADGKQVLWIDNEEPARRLYQRIAQHIVSLSAKSPVSMHTMRRLSGVVGKRYMEHLGKTDRIVVLDKADATTREIERFIHTHEPGLIVFDQLWKVLPPNKSSDEVGTQAYLFRWARSLAKEHCAVITAHQADSDAEGKAELGLSNLYLSRTAIQGEADVVIMMGRDKGWTGPAADRRMLSVVKNKMESTPGANRYPIFDASLDTSKVQLREATPTDVARWEEDIFPD